MVFREINVSGRKPRAKRPMISAPIASVEPLEPHRKPSRPIATVPIKNSQLESAPGDSSDSERKKKVLQYNKKRLSSLLRRQTTVRRAPFIERSGTVRSTATASSIRRSGAIRRSSGSVASNSGTRTNNQNKDHFQNPSGNRDTYREDYYSHLDRQKSLRSLRSKPTTSGNSPYYPPRLLIPRRTSAVNRKPQFFANLWRRIKQKSAKVTLYFTKAQLSRNLSFTVERPNTQYGIKSVEVMTRKPKVKEIPIYEDYDDDYNSHQQERQQLDKVERLLAKDSSDSTFLTLQESRKKYKNLLKDRKNSLSKNALLKRSQAFGVNNSDAEWQVDPSEQSEQNSEQSDSSSPIKRRSTTRQLIRRKTTLKIDNQDEIDAALEFVQTWSTYLRRAIAVRVVLREEMQEWEQQEEMAWQKHRSSGSDLSSYLGDDLSRTSSNSSHTSNEFDDDYQSEYGSSNYSPARNSSEHHDHQKYQQHSKPYDYSAPTKQLNLSNSVPFNLNQQAQNLSNRKTRIEAIRKSLTEDRNVDRVTSLAIPTSDSDYGEVGKESAWMAGPRRRVVSSDQRRPLPLLPVRQSSPLPKTDEEDEGEEDGSLSSEFANSIFKGFDDLMRKDSMYSSSWQARSTSSKHQHSESADSRYSGSSRRSVEESEVHRAPSVSPTPSLKRGGRNHKRNRSGKSHRSSTSQEAALALNLEYPWTRPTHGAHDSTITEHSYESSYPPASIHQIEQRPNVVRIPSYDRPESFQVIYA